MKIEAATGKLVWFKTLATDKPAPILPTNSGASLWGDRLFVSGAKTAILELKSGDIQWAFAPERVKSFPVKLPDPAAPPPAATLLASSGVSPGSYGSGLYGMSSGYAVPYSYRHVIGSLANPYSPYYPSPYYSGVNGPGGPAYLDYFHQNGAVGSGELRLVGTAVAWASLAESGVWRSGELLGGTLLLSDPSGTKLLRAGFPFGGKQLMAAGQYVGRCGRTACLLGGEVLFLVDTADGGVRHVSLQDVMHPGDPSVQVAIDGPVVYAIGVRGIAAIHARSGKRLSLEKWPKEVAPPAPPSTAESEWQTDPASPNLPASYGISAMSPGTAAPAERPPLAAVAAGRLYVTPIAKRVVALEEARATSSASEPVPMGKAGEKTDGR
jgi:hypothetical protein